MADRDPVLAVGVDAWRNEKYIRSVLPSTTPYGFDIVGAAWQAGGSFEAEQVAEVIALLPDVEVFVDVGANVGFYTCLARLHGKQTLAFEPIPLNLRSLYRNLEINKLDGVEVFPTAVTDRPSVLTLYGNDALASLIPDWNGPDPERRKRVTVVAGNCLDNVIGNRFSGRRMFIKIDVEGAELQVLRGAEQLLSLDPKPMWFVEISFKEHRAEINPCYLETFEFLWERGYEARTLDKERRLVTRDDVTSWIGNGERGFGDINWLFTGKS
jgi:FkbM family methyltransferase